MNETFAIHVLYKGEELYFDATLLRSAYNFKIEVDVKNEKIIFEQDEERNFRAVIYPEKSELKKINVELLKAIVEAIEAIVNRLQFN